MKYGAGVGFDGLEICHSVALDGGLGKVEIVWLLLSGTWYHNEHGPEMAVTGWYSEHGLEVAVTSCLSHV